MSYEQLRSLVGGDNPQGASYGDIISGIQSQYTPQSQFAPTRSLLDSIGTLVPDQPRIAYGALLQGQPATPIKMFGSTGANTGSIADSLASVDSGINNLGNALNVGLGGGQDLSGTLIYNNNFANNTDFTNNITAGDVTKTGSVMAALGTLTNSSDLAKAGVALNLIGSIADIKSETDVYNLATKIALMAAGPAGAAVNATIGAVTGNNRQLIDALTTLANPTLGALNSISSALTGQSLGTFGSGLLSAPTGSISDLGLLGASNYGNAIDRSAADVNEVLRDALTGGYDLTGTYDFRNGAGGGGKTDYWTTRAVNAE
jgi:hypothetical protein